MSQYVFTQPPLYKQDVAQGQFFNGVNWFEISVYHPHVKKHSLPNYLLLTGGRIVRCIHFLSKQPSPEFELKSPYPFPMTITIIPQVSPKIFIDLFFFKAQTLKLQVIITMKVWNLRKSNQFQTNLIYWSL